MFENLTSQQKIMFILLGIVALICLVLVLYFALSKKSCPDANKCAPPSLVKFRNTVSGTDIPWMTQTWYKYSYVDSKGNEGEQSDVSTDKIQSPNETDPIIQVIINSPYKIKIYRSVDNNNFKELTEVVVDTNGLFTDTNNPYTPPVIPPKPLVPPSLSSWGGGGGGGLQCPASSTKCTEPCTNSGGCGSDNPWQCTSGGAKGGCAKTNWETVPDCTAYCYIKS